MTTAPTAAYIAGRAYGAKMPFLRYLKMLKAFTDGRVNACPTRVCHAFLFGAYSGFISANPSVGIR